MSGKDQIALITGAHGFGLSTALLASLAAAGVCVVDLEDDREIETRHRSRDALDPFGIMDMLIGLDRRSSHYPEYPPPAPRRELQFNDTPKPLSKRRARRMRGRALA